MRKTMILAAAALGMSSAAMAQTTSQTSPTAYPMVPGSTAPTTTAPTMAHAPIIRDTVPNSPTPTDGATPATPSPENSAPDGTKVKTRKTP